MSRHCKPTCDAHCIVEPGYENDECPGCGLPASADHHHPCIDDLPVEESFEPVREYVEIGLRAPGSELVLHSRAQCNSWGHAKDNCEVIYVLKKI